MKLARTILKIIVVILVLPFVIAIFMKKTYHVEREIVINKPLDSVYQFVKYLKNQEEFSKWSQMDPKMKKTFKGTDGTPGFISAWESEMEEVGTGEQEIVHIVPNERIDYELRFLKPFESTSQAFMSTQAVDSLHTKVTWGFDGKMNYPMNLTMLVMDFEGILGKDFEVGLSNLKSILEKK